MTQKKPHVDGRGGAYVVGEDAIEQVERALNPGDAGYAEAIARTAVQDQARKGTLTRLPSHADLEEHPEHKPKQPKAERAAEPPQGSAPAAPSTGGKR